MCERILKVDKLTENNISMDIISADYDYDSVIDRTITLHFGDKRVEVDVGQVTTASLGLIFNLDASTVWLQDRIGNRIYIPDADGNFDLMRYSSSVHGVTVNGVVAVPSTTNASQSQSHTPSTASSSVTATPVTSSSGTRPFFHSVTSRRNKAKIKIVRSEITYSGNGRPNFSNIDVMFIDLNEDNADVNSILALVRGEFGNNFTIVGNDGLQIKDSPATRGV
jgi:hypothetical protein